MSGRACGRAGALLAALLAAATAAAEQPGASAAAKANHCVGCHQIPGYRSVFPDIYLVPKIAGQNAAYLAAALAAYRSGERSHPSMRAIAAQLTDDDIKVLADFYAGGGQ